MRFNEQPGRWLLGIHLSSFHPTKHPYPQSIRYSLRFPFRHWGQSGGNLKNNLSLRKPFSVLFSHCWQPEKGRGPWGCGTPYPRDVPSLSPLSLQHPALTKPTKSVCQKHLHLAAWCRYVAPALPSPRTISSMVLPLKIISPFKGEGGGRGQSLVQGTKCLDPTKFKGTLPPARRRDVAGRRMAGGHTDGKVCNNPFITLQILVLLAFAAAIFLLGNWWSE